MSEFNASKFKKEHGNEGPDLVGVTELTSPHFMVPPSGTTSERPDNPAPGTLRFNTDYGRLEYFKGGIKGWETIEGVSPNLGGGTGSNTGLGTRGFNLGGYQPDYTDTIEYLTISTLGNSEDFGNLSNSRHLLAAGGNKTRALASAGAGPSHGNIIDSITVTSLGDATDFGDTLVPRYGHGAVNNQTRMVHMAGYWPGGSRNDMDYNTISSTGNSVDFGNAVQPAYAPSDCNSSTRGILVGGNHPTPGTNHINVLQYITMSTLGDSLDFGDTSVVQYYSHGGVSSATRGVFGGSYRPSMTDAIDYITMTTLGNSVDFGDLTVSRFSLTATSSTTRGVFMGGKTPSVQNTIDYITISTTGNALDFGDKQTTTSYGAATSNGHGGL